MKVVLKSRTSDKDVRYLPFGMTDDKGRTIGCLITTGQEEFVFSIAPDVSTWYERISPGKYWYFVPHITRDSQPYGAAQSARRFDSFDKMQAAIDFYIADATKRYLRKFCR